MAKEGREETLRSPFSRRRQRERHGDEKRSLLPISFGRRRSLSLSRYLPPSPFLLLESDSLEGDENVGEEERRRERRTARAVAISWKETGRGREGEGDR